MSFAGTYRHIVWPLVPSALLMGWIPICPENEFSALMKACHCNPKGTPPQWPSNEPTCPSSLSTPDTTT